MSRAWENLCMAMLGEQFMVIVNLQLSVSSANYYILRQGMKYAGWSFP